MHEQTPKLVLYSMNMQNDIYALLYTDAHRCMHTIHAHIANQK